MNKSDQVKSISKEITEDDWKDTVISACLNGMSVIETVAGLKDMGITVTPELVNDIFTIIEQTLLECQDDPTMNVIH